MGQRVLAIINPVSSNGKTWRRWSSLRQSVQDIYGGFDEVFTSAKGEAVALTRKAVYEGYSHIIAVGGDGTINEVINGFFDNGNLINPKVNLGVVPSGSGSDFVRTLASSLSCSCPMNTFPVDVGKIDYEDETGLLKTCYFINISDTGIGAATIERVERGYKKFGSSMGFLLAALVSMIFYKNRDLVISLDNQHLKGRFASIVVANGQYFGGGMKIAPQARLDSGNFQVVTVGDLSKPTFIRNLMKVYSGTHLSHPQVNCYTSKSVSISSNENLQLETDGEYLNVRKVRFTLIPKAINVSLNFNKKFNQIHPVKRKISKGF